MGPLGGKMYVMETLRQICLKNYSFKKWLNYIYQYQEICIKEKNLEKCSFEKMKSLNISNEIIEDCINKSFIGIDFDLSDNYLLKKEKIAQGEKKYSIFPTILINSNFYYKGLLKKKNFFDFFCKIYEIPPKECGSQKDKKKNINSLNKKNRSKEKSSENISLGTLFILLLSFFTLISIIFFAIKKVFCKEKLNEDISVKVSMMIDKYFILNDYYSQESQKFKSNTNS